MDLLKGGIGKDENRISVVECSSSRIGNLYEFSDQYDGRLRSLQSSPSSDFNANVYRRRKLMETSMNFTFFERNPKFTQMF